MVVLNWTVHDEVILDSLKIVWCHTGITDITENTVCLYVATCITTQ